MNYRNGIVVLLIFLGVLGTAQDSTVSVQIYEETSNVDQLNLGVFSMSLAVKNIKTSFEFYQNLGFRHLEGAGGIDEKWMIIINGDIKIGLFQDMFPTNTLTFNPENARKIYKSLDSNDIDFLFSIGLESKSGPCSFSFLDPDANPILIDQQ